MSAAISAPSSTATAYGFEIRGLTASPELNASHGEPLPHISIRQEQGQPGDGPFVVDEERAETEMGVLRAEGRIFIDRGARTATVVNPEPLGEDELLHPQLMRAAAVFAYWDGHEPFHAGAVLGSSGALCLVGGTGAGKSTMLASLAARGYGVLTDDLAIISEGWTFAGPRCVDVRPWAAEHIRARSARPVRNGFRMRIPLQPVPFRAPVGGWIYLGWSREPELVPVPAEQRLQWLVANRMVTHHAKNPAALLDLAALPAWELRRPRSLEALDSAAELLLDLL